jgi:N-acetylneuraminic acid mutarotase
MRFLSPIFVVVVSFIVAGPVRAQNWVDLTPSTGPAPPARALASAVLDTLATHTWAEVTPSTGSSPQQRNSPVSVYDPVGHRMVTWSGQRPGVFFNDAWAFDLTTNLWSEYTPAGGPPNQRYGAAGVYDPTAGDLVTFAGFTSSGRFDDVWRLDAAGATWTDVSSTPGPLERCLHSASYDSQGHRLIMYGGQNAGPRDDMWAFDLALETWTELTPVVSPPGRWFTAHVYEPAGHRAVIFGGNTSSAVTNEVWTFDLATNTWQQLTPLGTPPSAREGSAAIYDAAEDRMVVFGGRNGDYNNEVWAIVNLSGAATGAGESPPAVEAVLNQNHPNPFNPTTTIEYDIPSPGQVSLVIYDVRGVRVGTLANGTRAAGPHSVVWNGRDDNGAAVASGVYIYRLEYGGRAQSRKLVVLK